MPNPSPRRVLVIGGGVAGLVTLRNLIKLGEQKGHFDRVELVERRDDVGGVWYVLLSAHFAHPHCPPYVDLAFLTPIIYLIVPLTHLWPRLSSTHAPFLHCGHHAHSHATRYLDNPPPNSATPRWPSPAYPGLIGNVLPEYLSYSDYPPFPTPPGHPEQPFPTLQETYEYLKGFANSLSPGRIRLNTEVVRVVEKDGPVQSKDGGNGWTVVLRDWNEGGKEREEERKEKEEGFAPERPRGSSRCSRDRRPRSRSSRGRVWPRTRRRVRGTGTACTAEPCPRVRYVGTRRTVIAALLVPPVVAEVSTATRRSG